MGIAIASTAGISRRRRGHRRGAGVSAACVRASRGPRRRDRRRFWRRQLRARPESSSTRNCRSRWSSRTGPSPPARSATTSSPGLRSIEQQQFGYDRIAAGGVTVVAQAATAIDAKGADRRARRRHVARLRPAGAVARRRSALRRAAGLRRSRRAEDAACLESRRADAAAAQATRSHGRRRRWW